MRAVRPQVVVTYDENGGYGHPDHIQAHRVTMRAVELAAAEGIAPNRVYWTAIPLSVLRLGITSLAESTDNPFAGVTRVEDLPFGTPDDKVSVQIDAHAFADAKMAAVRAHATQIPESSWLYTLASNFGADYVGVEYFSLAAGDQDLGAVGEHGWANDLFAGLDLTDAR